MSIAGVLIAESLRIGSVVEGVPLTVTKISRVDGIVAAITSTIEARGHESRQIRRVS